MADIKKLICPKCRTYWATLDFTDYPAIESSDLKILHGKRKRPRNGDSVRCSSCGYDYTTWDIVLAGASPDASPDIQPGQRSAV